MSIAQKISKSNKILKGKKVYVKKLQCTWRIKSKIMGLNGCITEIALGTYT